MGNIKDQKLHEAVVKINRIRNSLNEVSASLVGRVDDDTLAYYNNLVKGFDYLIDKIDTTDDSRISADILKKPFMNKRLTSFLISSEISKRTLNALVGAGIESTLDLTYVTPPQLYQVRNLGKKAIDEVKNLCRCYSINLGSNSDNIPSYREGDIVTSLIDKNIIGFREEFVRKGSKFVVISEKNDVGSGIFKLTTYKCKPIGAEDSDFTIFSIGSIEKTK